MSYNEIPKEDNGPFKEYSVIYTDRALNLMSPPFQHVMRDLSSILKATYNCEKVAVIPGSGTFGMEAVARQYVPTTNTNEKDVLVIRNGWFSFRWTEIFDFMGGVPHAVLKAQPVAQSQQHQHPQQQYAPHDMDAVVAKIQSDQPAVVFAPHVETSTGMILSNEFIESVGSAVHSYGGLFVLDCIASGTVWIDMKTLGVDVLISAPQKGWSGPACCGLVMLSEAAVTKLETTQESSFAMSLKKWVGIMDKYVGGAFGYHTTMPTDGLRDFHNVAVEMQKVGMETLKQAQLELGVKARAALKKRGLISVASDGWEAPGVLVFYTPNSIASAVIGGRFKEHGLQVATGVPWEIGEPQGVQTFRVGLFGLDKLCNVDRTVQILEEALDKVLAEE